jgi:hypothetical protein
MAGEVLLPEGEWRVTDYCLEHVCHISKIISMLKEVVWVCTCRTGYTLQFDVLSVCLSYVKYCLLSEFQ